MIPKNPNYQALVKAIFAQAGFVSELGLELHDMGPGWCETRLQVGPRHLQQNGFVHAGVQATMADHTAGGAAATLMTADQVVLTVEFKINLLRPAVGQQLHCRAEVVKAGQTIAYVESAVYANNNDSHKLVSKLAATMAYTTSN